MQKLLTKLLALLPKNSEGQELAEYGITWSVFELNNGSPALMIRWGGLEIQIVATGRKVTGRAGSFEALICQAVMAAYGWEAYRKYVHVGRLGTMELVHYILYKDLNIIANEIIAAEKLDMKSNGRAVGTICRKVFRFPVFRTKNGWAVILDETQIEEWKSSYGFEE